MLSFVYTWWCESVYAPVRAWSVNQGCFLWWSVNCHVKNKDQEFLICCRDCKNYIGQLAKGFEGVAEGLAFGERNIEGEKLLKFASSLDLLWQI